MTLRASLIGVSLTNGHMQAWVYDPEGDVNFEIIVTDSVGIQSNPVIETTNGSSVIFDRTLPVISNLHIESNNNNDSTTRSK